VRVCKNVNKRQKELKRVICNFTPKVGTHANWAGNRFHALESRKVRSLLPRPWWPDAFVKKSAQNVAQYIFVKPNSQP
jgi:hypothetical protein